MTAPGAAALAATPPAALAGFGRLVRAEVLKLRTTRTWWVLLLAMLGPMVLFSAVIGAIGGTPAGLSRVRFLLQQITFAKYFVMVLGILLFTNEFQHNTATSTFLVATRRWVVLAAKLVTGLLLGAAYAAVGLGVALGVGLGVAALAGNPTGFDGDVVVTMVRMVVVQALYGALGVGVGSVLRNQVLSVIATLAYLLMLEGVARAILLFLLDWPGVASVLVGSAEQSLVGAMGPEGFQGADLGLVPPWLGALVFLAWIAVFAALGGRGLLRRDIG